MTRLAFERLGRGWATGVSRFTSPARSMIIKPPYAKAATPAPARRREMIPRHGSGSSGVGPAVRAARTSSSKPPRRAKRSGLRSIGPRARRTSYETQSSRDHRLDLPTTQGRAVFRSGREATGIADDESRPVLPTYWGGRAGQRRTKMTFGGAPRPRNETGPPRRARCQIGWLLLSRSQCCCRSWSTCSSCRCAASCPRTARRRGQGRGRSSWPARRAGCR